MPVSPGISNSIFRPLGAESLADEREARGELYGPLESRALRGASVGAGGERIERSKGVRTGMRGMSGENLGSPGSASAATLHAQSSAGALLV